MHRGRGGAEPDWKQGPLAPLQVASGVFRGLWLPRGHLPRCLQRVFEFTEAQTLEGGSPLSSEDTGTVAPAAGAGPQRHRWPMSSAISLPSPTPGPGMPTRHGGGELAGPASVVEHLVLL